MSTLHTRGYRPKPGERISGSGDTRSLWLGCYQHMRALPYDEAIPMDSVAIEVLALRAASDPLFVAAHARQRARIAWRVAGYRRALGDSLAPTMERLGRELVDAFQRGES